MRQRVVGAMAIAAPPRLLIADEPTTSLDLTIQAQYLGLLKELQQRHRFALIFVTHNLGIVAKICDRVAVMYAGRIVERGRCGGSSTPPAHPYTRALLESDPAARRARGAPHRHRGPAAGPGAAARGLRVRPALPARHGAVPGGGAARAAASATGTWRAAGSRRRAVSGPLLEVRGG